MAIYSAIELGSGRIDPEFDLDQTRDEDQSVPDPIRSPSTSAA
jgi:hypothetical protein